MQWYFLELNEGKAPVVRNPSPVTLLSKVSMTNLKMNFWNYEMILQHMTCSLKNPRHSSGVLWSKHHYPSLTMLPFRCLLPFDSICLFEAGFSILVRIKTKSRNRLNVEDDMRLALTNTSPRISSLVCTDASSIVLLVSIYAAWFAYECKYSESNIWNDSVSFLVGCYSNIFRVAGNGWARRLCKLLEWGRKIKRVGNHWSTPSR